MTLGIGLPLNHETDPTDQEISVFNFLMSQVDSTGGIPASKPGDPSGQWTTAATLSVMSWGFSKKKAPELINHLLSGQISSGSDKGSWPLVTGNAGSTLATADTIRALHVALSFPESSSFTQRIHTAISAGVSWLNHTRTNNSWGHVGNQDSSIFATTSALMALKATDNLSDPTLSGARNFILSLQDSQTGGWYASVEAKANKSLLSVSDTARALVALIYCFGWNNTHKEVSAGLRYLKTAVRVPSKVRYRKNNNLVAGQGMVVLNDNSLCDVSVCLSYATRKLNRYTAKLADLLHKTLDQGPPMKWRLADARQSEDITTWPSADWLEAQGVMRATLSHLGDGPLIRRCHNLLRWQLLFWILPIGICLVAFLFFLSPFGVVGMAGDISNILTKTVIGLIIIGILAAAFWEGVKELLRKVFTRK